MAVRGGGNQFNSGIIQKMSYSYMFHANNDRRQRRLKTTAYSERGRTTQTPSQKDFRTNFGDKNEKEPIPRSLCSDVRVACKKQKKRASRRGRR